MWILQPYPENKGSIQYYLLEDQIYVIGRKDCDINLFGDASISRKHAQINVHSKIDESSTKTTVNLRDLSKLGVQLNGVNVRPKVDVQLKSDDVVSFGRTQQKFSLHSYKLTVVTSCISNSQKTSQIKQTVQDLGGEISNEWNNDATHLVMDRLTFTIKRSLDVDVEHPASFKIQVVYALASLRYVVKPQFFEDVITTCKQKKGCKLPDENNYLPAIAEQNLSGLEYLFVPNSQRKSLLLGKFFVSLNSKQYKRMKPAVELCGGEIELKADKDNSLFHALTNKQIIVLKVETKEGKTLSTSQKYWINEVYDKVKNSHLRLVRESEVGLAILHVSLESFCNPTTVMPPALPRGTHTQVLTDTLVGTQNTQLLRQHSEIKKTTEIITKQHLLNENMNGLKRKHKIVDSSEDENTLKKPKLTQQQLWLHRDGFSKPLNGTGQENEISDAEFSFKLVDSTLASSKHENKKCDSEILEPDTALSVFGETVGTKSFGNNILCTPASKRSIPDTFTSTARKKSESNRDQYFNAGDPFSFSISEPTTCSDISKVVKDVIGSNVKVPSQQTLDVSVGHILADRFLKAAASSQESSNEDILYSDEDGNLTSKGNSDNLIRAVSVAPLKKNLDDISLQKNVRKDITGRRNNFSEIDKNDLLYLLNDDDFISEEFPLVGDKTSKWDGSLEGFLSTVNKKSEVVQIKSDPDLGGVDRDLIKTVVISLVVQKENVNERTANIYQPSFTKGNRKNFKLFKKQNYAGNQRFANRRTIDFVVFEGENEEKNHLFNELREKNNKEDEEARRLDVMFDFGECVRKSSR